MHVQTMEDWMGPFLQTRRLMEKALEPYSIKALNHIPPGFNNNMVWHLGHVLVSQQLLVYQSFGLPKLLPEATLGLYGAGTKPGAPVGMGEYRQLRQWLFDLAEQTISDAKGGLFQHMQSRTTGSGYLLEKPQDAFAVNNVHEAIHLGYLMALKRVVALT